MLAGNFNAAAKEAPAIRAFREEGFSIPPSIVHPSHLLTEKYYGLLAFLLNQDADGRTARIRRSGVINPYESVFRDEDWPVYEVVVRKRQKKPTPVGPRPEPGHWYLRFWRTQQLSDHPPSGSSWS